MAKKKTTQPQTPPPPSYPITFETFREIDNYWRGQLTDLGPTCWNGRVSIVKYKVTIEVVEEPIEVLQQRVQDLWDYSDNYHHNEPLCKAAAKIGYKLQGSRGSKKGVQND